MATFKNDRKIVTSDGITTTVTTNGVQQTFGTSEYTTVTPLTSTTYTQGNLLQMGTSRNVDIVGNSQENYAGRGITCDYSIKVVGNPEIFTGLAQMGADKELAGLISVILQEGDDRKTAAPRILQGVDPKQLVSNLSSSYQSTVPLDLPPIRKLSDIGVAFAKLGAWTAGLTAADAAYQAAKAAEITIEQQQRRMQNNINAQIEQYGEVFDTSKLLASSTATDVNQGNYNITKQVVMENYLPNQDALLAHQKNIG